jgi:hypothetical protein
MQLTDFKSQGSIAGSTCVAKLAEHWKSMSDCQMSYSMSCPRYVTISAKLLISGMMTCHLQHAQVILQGFLDGGELCTWLSYARWQATPYTDHLPHCYLRVYAAKSPGMLRFHFGDRFVCRNNMLPLVPCCTIVFPVNSSQQKL